jgi:hypothetical protein
LECIFWLSERLIIFSDTNQVAAPGGVGHRNGATILALSVEQRCQIAAPGGIGHRNGTLISANLQKNGRDCISIENETRIGRNFNKYAKLSVLLPAPGGVDHQNDVEKCVFVANSRKFVIATNTPNCCPGRCRPPK